MVDEQGCRTGGDRRRGVGVTVVVLAAHAGEQHAGPHLPGVVRHADDLGTGVTHDASTRSPATASASAPSVWPGPIGRHSAQPVEPGGGWMPSSRTIVGASSRKTGADAVPPKRSSASDRRSSIEIRIVTCGSSAGRKPTKLA